MNRLVADPTKPNYINRLTVVLVMGVNPSDNSASRTPLGSLCFPTEFGIP